MGFTTRFGQVLDVIGDVLERWVDRVSELGVEHALTEGAQLCDFALPLYLHDARGFPRTITNLGQHVIWYVTRMIAKAPCV